MKNTSNTSNIQYVYVASQLSNNKIEILGVFRCEMKAISVLCLQIKDEKIRSRMKWDLFKYRTVYNNDLKIMLRIDQCLFN